MAEYIERSSIKYEQWAVGPLNEPLMVVRKKTIDSIPAADVAPVRHGRWDDSGRYQFPSGAKAIRCSICGCALNESEYRLFNWNYCPVCGAKMDFEGGDGNG